MSPSTSSPSAPAFGLALVLLAWPAADAAAQPTPPARVIKCDGPFAHDAGHDDLVRAFGDGNVVYQDIPGAEGEPTRASIVFPDDPKARLEVFWSEEEARRGPIIRMRGESSWSTSNGIRLRLPIADIEKLNGKPFKLSGFGWDYGGQVVSWQKGALDKPQPGGCSIGVSFNYPENAPERSVAKVLGEKEFLSNNPNIRAVKPFVAEITVANPKR